MVVLLAPSVITPLVSISNWPASGWLWMVYELTVPSVFAETVIMVVASSAIVAAPSKGGVLSVVEPTFHSDIAASEMFESWLLYKTNGKRNICLLICCTQCTKQFI